MVLGFALYPSLKAPIRSSKRYPYIHLATATELTHLGVHPESVYHAIALSLNQHCLYLEQGSNNEHA